MALRAAKMENPNNTTTQGEPIGQFAQCHIGIIQKLERLDELPALLEPAARARKIASESVDFFRDAIFEHHLDEIKRPVSEGQRWFAVRPSLTLRVSYPRIHDGFAILL